MESLKNTVVNFDTTKDAHGWIQFKGTDLCMDVYCKCGIHTHIDGEFIYYLECPSCKTVYELNGHIQLIEITAKEALNHNVKKDYDSEEIEEFDTWK